MCHAETASWKNGEGTQTRVKISGGMTTGGRMIFRGLYIVGVSLGLIAVCGCGLSFDAEKGAETMESPAVHPEIWPAIDNPVPIDPEIETRIDDLLARMSVEDKVGQVVQGEIRHLEPKDVRKYRLGSVLNGGGVQPFGKKWASVEDWLALADAFWEASMDTSDGGVAIPVIWGTDAVHGHTNVVRRDRLPPEHRSRRDPQYRVDPRNRTGDGGRDRRVRP